MVNFPLPRIDTDNTLRNLLLKHCSFKEGDIWIDSEGKHKIACIDATDEKAVKKLLKNKKASLALHDPPYNFVAFDERKLDTFIEWSKQWIKNSYNFLLPDSSLYIWLGADQNNHFQPLSDFMLIDATDEKAVKKLLKNKKASLALHDPPYNFVAFDERKLDTFIEWSKQWIKNSYNFLLPDSSLYIWLGADQNNHFQPLSDFML